MGRKEEDEEEEKKKTEEASIDELASAVGKIHVSDDTDDFPPSLKTIAEWIEQASNILVLSGAGVSVAAGIPDFRTPGTGLYDNLQKYNLPYPEAVFDLAFYRRNPKPFVSLAKEIWPGFRHTPTLTHSFLAVLAERKRLLRNYTQNIDGLEFLASVPAEKIVECHGHFRTASCIRCGKSADAEIVKQQIVQEAIAPKCKSCKAYVKPDIVFFGEDLPDRFHTLLKPDLREADLCLVLGTSLQVAPVSMIPERVNCRRILLNRELVGDFSIKKKSDMFHAGDCDDSILAVAKILGWEEDLLKARASAQASIGGGKPMDDYKDD